MKKNNVPNSRSRQNMQLEMKSLVDRLNQRMERMSQKRRTDEANPATQEIDLLNQINILRDKAENHITNLENTTITNWDDQLPAMQTVFDEGEKLLTIPNL